MAERVGQHPEDLIARLEPRDADPDLLHHAREIPSEGERRIRWARYRGCPSCTASLAGVVDCPVPLHWREVGVLRSGRAGFGGGEEFGDGVAVESPQRATGFTELLRTDWLSFSELGYRPNLSARSMGRGRTGFIAFAVPSLSNPHFAEFAGRVINAARRHHWTVLIEETGGRKTSEDTVVNTMPYLVDGIILHPESLIDDDVEDRARDTPIVLLGERGLEHVADRVVADNVA
jgi:hypothetical protein